MNELVKLDNENVMALEEIELSGNKIGMQGFNALKAYVLNSTSVTTFDIRFNAIQWISKQDQNDFMNEWVAAGKARENLRCFDAEDIKFEEGKGEAVKLIIIEVRKSSRHRFKTFFVRAKLHGSKAVKVIWHGKWYDATVTHYNQSADTYDVKYDDGTVDHNIPSEEIKFED